MQGVLRAEIKLYGVALLNYLPVVAFRLGCIADLFAVLSTLHQLACLDTAEKNLLGFFWRSWNTSNNINWAMIPIHVNFIVV